MNEKTVEKYASVLARLVKVGLYTVTMGAKAWPEASGSLGDGKYGFFLSKRQVKVGQKLLDIKNA